MKRGKIYKHISHKNKTHMAFMHFKDGNTFIIIKCKLNYIEIFFTYYDGKDQPAHWTDNGIQIIDCW